MRVPMKWLRELVALPAETTTSQLAEALTRAGLQVERIELTGAGVSGPVVVGRVLEFVAEPQKNGKTIRWCQVEVGAGTVRGIVCGADNFSAGDLVVVALPGARLPGGFAISARKTYGHVSDGMICAADELGIGDDHSGILVLPRRVAGQDVLPGADALALLEARDEVLEIDVTPDIGYCLSMRGIAREAAQAFNMPFTDPYRIDDWVAVEGGYPVHIETPRCASFVALTISGVRPDAPTPPWMAARLVAAGMRSISLAVDITNYVMLESGQPLHAYDADRLRGAIVVRQARPGERLVTLDDVERVLTVEDMLIADDSGPIGLAGVMGGQTTELAADTRNIVLEAACFDAASVAGTFRRHNLPSEAATRFARGVDPALPLAAARMAARLLVELAGGRDARAHTIVGGVPAMPAQRIRADLPGRILGAPLAAAQVIEVLVASGVKVQNQRDDQAGDWLLLEPPTWRPDLVDQYDYVEEVGRKVGFDVVRAEVPRARAGRGLSFAQRSRRAVLRAVAEAGFVELITLPFLGAADLDRLGLPPGDSRRRVVRLANPLADNQPFLRTTLLPGLFAAVNRNTSRSIDDLALFECGAVFLANDRGPAPQPDVARRPSPAEIAAVTGNLPDQPRMLAGVLAGDWVPAGWHGPAVPADWRHAIHLAEVAAGTLGLRLQRVAGHRAGWHPGRCAVLLAEGVPVGHAGELHPGVIRAFGLPERSCAVELDLDALIAAAPRGGEVQSIGAFPLLKEDVALIVDAVVSAAEVQAALTSGAGELLESIRLFDVYTGPQIGVGKKSLAYALGFRAADRTLTEAEASAAREQAVACAVERCGAVQRA